MKDLLFLQSTLFHMKVSRADMTAQPPYRDGSVGIQLVNRNCLSDIQNIALNQYWYDSRKKHCSKMKTV